MDDLPAWASILISILLPSIAIAISIFAWLASRRNARAAEESADVARKSYELQKQSYEQSIQLIEEQQKKENARKEALRREYAQKVLKSALDVEKAVLGKYTMQFTYEGQPAEIDWESIKHVQKNIPYSETILAEYFTDEERKQIHFAWDSLNSLFKEYSEDDGEKDGNRIADNRLGMGYAGMLQHFNILISKLERLH